MGEYQGYLVQRNPATGRWEIFWQGKKLDLDFDRETDAEEWIDDQFPLNR